MNIDKEEMKKARNVFQIDLHRDYKSVQQLIGLVVFIVIFIFSIPMMLFKKGYINLLAAYMPNLDLIANVVSYHGGPYIHNFVSELYPPTPTTLHGFLSQSFVNWCALMGLTFLVADETHKTGNFYTGWSLGFVMIFMTYLLPGQFISGAMDKAYEYLEKQQYFPIFHHKKGDSIWTASVIVGFIVAAFVVYLEGNIIGFLRERGLLTKFAKFIVNFPKRF